MTPMDLDEKGHVTILEPHDCIARKVSAARSII
jgi:hypothetical protein